MEDRRMRVYVPVPGSMTDKLVLDGSGIVGRPTDDGERVVIHYEGNKYGAVNLDQWEQRVHHAWGRAVHHAPTVAMAAVPADELVKVGWYDGRRLEVHSSRQDAIDEYLARSGDLAPWVTRFTELRQDQPVERMALVWALSAADAQTRSGLIAEPFVRASDDDLDDWLTAMEAGDDDKVLQEAVVALRRRARDIGRERRRARRSGRWDDSSSTFDSNRVLAHRLTLAAARLELMIARESEEVPDGH